MSPTRALIAFVLLGCGSSSGHPIDEYWESYELVEDTWCACPGESVERCSDYQLPDPATLECHRQVYDQYEDEFAPIYRCLAAVDADFLDCLDAAGCDEDARQVCDDIWEPGLSACGRVSDEADDAEDACFD